MREWLYGEFVYSVPYIETLLTKSTITDDVFNIRDMWSDIWPSDGLVITSKQLHRINNKIIQDSQAFKFKSETAQTEVQRFNIVQAIMQNILLITMLV